MNRAGRESNSQREPHVFLKVNKTLLKINLNDILFIESLKDYIKVITTLEDYVVHKSISAITEELPQSSFIRMHRSFTISINKIIALEGNTVEI
jgi:DNA-binding LytR/AlgR family response regulator